MAAQPKSSFLKAVLAGGLVAGVVDIFTAIITFHMTAPQFGQVLAAGWVGREAAKAGGMPLIVAGYASHLGIAVIDALIFCFFAARTPQMRQHWIVAGLVFGLCVYAVMNAIVVPLSAYHGASKAMANPQTALIGILEHMILFGLPIAYAARRYLGKPG